MICRVVHPTYIVGGGLLSARVPSLRSVSPLISLFSFLVSLTHDNDARAYTYAISNKHPDFLLTLFDPSSRASLCAVFFSRFLLALVSCVLVDSEGATRICLSPHLHRGVFPSPSLSLSRWVPFSVLVSPHCHSSNTSPVSLGSHVLHSSHSAGSRPARALTHIYTHTHTHTHTHTSVPVGFTLPVFRRSC